MNTYVITINPILDASPVFSIEVNAESLAEALAYVEREYGGEIIAVVKVAA